MVFLTQLDWSAFLLAMLIIELTPGPNMGWLATLSAQYGMRVGLMAVAGITLGLALQVIAAATGFAALIASFPALYHLLRWAGVIFMLWLAWLAYAENASPVPATGLNEKGFRRGLIANLLNPKALVFYVVVNGHFSDRLVGYLWWQLLLLGSIHLAIALTVHTAIVISGASLGAQLEKWRKSLAARLIFAFSLAAIAIWIAISTG